MDVDDAPGLETSEGEPDWEDLFSETESLDDSLLDEAPMGMSDSSDGELDPLDPFASFLPPEENPQDAEGSCGERERERSPRRVGRYRARRADTLILLDWDDTLLPSTWLQQNGLRIDSGLISDAQSRELSVAARAAARTIRAAKRLGSVVLVTNAEWGWVELSCRKFVPTLWPLLENVKIRSARGQYETKGVVAPAKWKRAAFREELRLFCRDLRCDEKDSSSRRLRNIISLGDAAHERDALLSMTQESTDCWGKSVKLMERPDMRVFAKQHKMLSTVLQPIVKHRGTLDLCLQLG